MFRAARSTSFGQNKYRQISIISLVNGQVYVYNKYCFFLSSLFFTYTRANVNNDNAQIRLCPLLHTQAEVNSAILAFMQ